AINVSLARSGCLNNLLGEERSRRRRTSIICERAARRLELVPSLIKRCRQNMSCFRVKGCFPEQRNDRHNAPLAFGRGLLCAWRQEAHKGKEYAPRPQRRAPSPAT